MPPKSKPHKQVPAKVTAHEVVMYELNKIKQYQKLIMRNQIIILDAIGALAVKMTGEIPVISVDIPDIAGGTTTVAVLPDIKDVEFRQVEADSSSMNEE